MVTKRIREYGIENKVNTILLKKNEADFRKTLGEIVKDYPQTKMQKAENIISDFNRSTIENFKNMNPRENLRNYDSS